MMRFAGPSTFVVVAALAATVCASQGGVGAPAAGPAPQHDRRSEKEARTPAQAKMDSQLLYEVYRARGTARQHGVPPGPTTVRIDSGQRALVDVRAEVTPALRKRIQTLGGTIQSTAPRYRSTIAWIPLRRLERLAQDAAVYAITPAAEASIR
jgi:hypothetical protein